MTLRFSISAKLLLLILPLVCLPMAVVGYYAVHASVERVNRLVRQEQMLKVKVRAAELNDIFYYCRLDVETIAGLPVLEDFFHARSFRLEAEAGFNRDKIVRLFSDFIARTPHYFQIRFVDPAGREVIKVGREGRTVPLLDQRREPFFLRSRDLGPDGLYMSPVRYSAQRQGFVMHWARPIYTGWKEFAGLVVVDLDHESIIDLVRRIRIGRDGYAFLVDDRGRILAHPRFAPYTYGIDDATPSLREVLAAMVTGQSSWRTYEFEDERKLAAYAPVPLTGWSLAVTVPREEIRKEAYGIQVRVLQVAVFTLVAAVLCVLGLSWYMLRPVRNLVEATDRIATGDLRQEIPIQTRDELGDLTKSFNRMVKNLARIRDELVRSEKLIALGRLSAGVAHEIRNPLNAMKGAVVHLQRRRSEDPLIGEYLQLVSEEIDRLSAFVSEFLLFARQAEPSLEPTDINRMIRNTLMLFEEQARSRGIRLHERLDPHLPSVDVDPRQIEQVLVNLVVNGMDALPEGGDVTVSSRHRPPAAPGQVGEVRIQVTDNGVGIDPEHRNSIFDPFFSTKEDGTGLGLPLSLGIVENHGGTLIVRPREHVGTAVTVRLPLRRFATEDGGGHEDHSGGGRPPQQSEGGGGHPGR